MKCESKLLFWAGLGLLAVWPAGAGDIILSEIMYHPAPAVPEDVRQEWIELYNKGTNTVNLSGWRLSQGVDFTIPSNTALGAGKYLVVAADLIAFMNKYPGVTNVVGNWVGSLANNGEAIRLDNAQGNEQDSVQYASEGDWSIRQRGPLDPYGQRGWVWYSEHDGLGKSLELINPLMPNANGQNWAASRPANGTPGTANSVLNTNTAPFILDVTHSPAMPKSTDSILITARVTDELTNGVTVTVYYRNATNPPAPFTSSPMSDDGLHGDGIAGNGIYGVYLAPQANSIVIEFYLVARDAAGNMRTNPLPALNTFDPPRTPNYLLQVDNSIYTDSRPLVHLIMTETERAELAGWNRNSDAQADATVVTLDSVGTKVRHLAGIRYRGHGTRGNNPPNYHVNFANDNKWNGVRGINLNAVTVPAQVAGSVLFQAAGLPMADSRPAQVRVNSTNLAGGASFYYALNEALSSEMAENHFPLDQAGNVYRGVRRDDNSFHGNFIYRGENKDSYTNVYFKQSNTSQDNWMDLIEVCRVLATNAPDAQYEAEVNRVVDVENWLLYFAVNTLADNNETSLSNGYGDDYASYYGILDPRWKLMAYDTDSVLSLQGSSATAGLFRMIDGPFPGALTRFINSPEFMPRYYATLKRLIETTFSPAQINPLLDRALGGWAATATINAMKNFVSQRNPYVLARIPTNLTIVSTLTLNNGYFYTTTPTVTFSGQASVIDTRRVLVNGVSATWNARQGTWSGSASLQPGINRVLVQSIGTNGVEVTRGTMDIWYDDASTVSVSGTLPTDTTWTAAGGPYLVTANLTVPAGRVLTIDPGVTVFFQGGVGLTVNGRLQAEGTETQRIRFTRLPAAASVTNSWIGMTFANSSEVNTISYADFEGAGSVNHSVGVTNAGLVLDHCAFSGTTRTYIEVGNAAFAVRNSIFPGLTAAELIHGVDIRTNGFAIIEGNFFGTTTGLNDIIHFSRARRPGPILQVLNNTFTGASDDVLDLDGCDAHVEGNIFMRVSNGDPTEGADTASGISYGAALVGGTNYGPHVVVVRNLFFDVDHAVLCKAGGSLTLVNNTIVGARFAAVNFSEPQSGTLPGASAYVDGNIFWNPAGYSGTNFENALPTNGTVQLVVNRSILAATDFLANGTGNLNVDPRLANLNANTITFQTITNDFRLLSGSPARGTGPNGLDMGALVPAGASITGEPPTTTHLTSATLTVGGPGIVNYVYRVNNGPYSTPFPVSTSIPLTGLPNGTYTVYVLGQNSAGVWQLETNVAVSKSWTINTAYSRVLINEVLARNVNAVPVNGETPDLIELYNAGGAVVDLSGWGITDSPSNKFKFKFPMASAIEPGDYRVLYADNETVPPGSHLGFPLNQDGDDVYLYDNRSNLVDSVVFGPQLADLSIGRLGDGSWALTRPTFGALNIAQPVGESRTLKINEWGAEGFILFNRDFIELYNPDSLPVALSGLYVTDAPQGAPTQHEITPLSFIAARGLSVFIADGVPADGANHLNFQLAPEQGQIGLFARDLTLIDYVFYGLQYPDISEGRRPNGSSNFDFFTLPTPGSGNPRATGTCTVTNFTISLMPLTNVWRYDEADNLDGVNWTAPNYNDLGWSNGPALLAFENNASLMPLIRTTLADPRTPAPGQSAPRTYYFRTTVVLNTNLAGYNLVASTYIDDGAVVYTNGVEAFRVRMPLGTPTNATLATGTPPSGGDAALETFNLPLSSLIQGTNVIAVEVHQPNATSSDIVWGMALDAVQSTTNCTQGSVVLNELMANNLTISNSDGSVSDWVELYNASTNTVNLSGMSLTDDVGQPQRWIFPAGVAISAGGYLIVRFDPNLPASTNAGGVLNTGFGLDFNGDGAYLYDQTGSLLDGVTFGLQVADFSIGRVPNASGGWVLTVPTLGAANIAASLGNPLNLKVNEWMADPRNGDDWFEIYNPNPQPVLMSGLYLTDNTNLWNQFQIPSLSFISSFTNGFAKFIADNNTPAGFDHVPFKLSAGGEDLAIYTSAGALIDHVRFGSQQKGVSEGRLPDGAGITRFPFSASPGESNYKPLTDVVVNEALTHTDPPFEDAIELQNLSPNDVDISGWFISDSTADLRKFRIPNGTTIPAGGFVVFYEYQFNSTPGFWPSFELDSAHGGEIFLSVADAAGAFIGLRDIVKFGAARNGVSFGRYETSAGADFTAVLQHTFGVGNPGSLAEFRAGTGRTNSGPRIGPVVINEIMYHPADVVSGGVTNDNAVDEYIELVNITGSTVQLFDPVYPTNQWKLRDAVDYIFPAATTIGAGEYILIVSFDPADSAALTLFRTKYGVGTGVRVFGPYGGKLDNGGESVELAEPDPPQGPGRTDEGFVPYVLVDKVKYNDKAPWPEAADSGTNNISIQRRVAAAYGNDPVNWLAGNPTAGTPNGPAVMTLPAITGQPQSQNVPLGANVTFSVTANGAPTLTYEWRLNGFVIEGATNSTLTVTNVQQSDLGRYTVLVSNPGGSVASATATLGLQSSPFISQQPQNQVVASGGTATFTIIAFGSAPLRYQWRKDGGNLANATNATLVINNAQVANEGGYTVIVTNSFGPVTSVVATLTINAPPGISQQPQSRTVMERDTVNFSVTATGSAPLSYQWRFNGSDIPGATSSNLALVNVQSSDAGNYTVVVTNLVGSMTSAAATLTVIPLPIVTVAATDPSAGEAGPDPATFTITRSYATNTALAVNFSLGGTAGNGIDYLAITSPVTIPANVVSTTLTVTPINDSLIESPETVFLTLLGGTNYNIGLPNSASVTVADDDNQSPSVTLTNPPNGTVFVFTPTNVTISATANDNDGTVVKVEFFYGGTNKIGEVTSGAYTIIWTNAPAGTNVLTAVATDNLGATRTSSPISVVVNAQPAVSITSPANSANIVGPTNVTVTAFANDSDGSIARVEFYYAGTNLIGVATNSPYSVVWSNVALASYALTARATDNRGAATVSSPVNITLVSGASFTNNFGARSTISGSPLTIAGANAGSTAQANEPNPTGIRNNNTVWIAWTATFSSPVVMDTFGSSIDTVLAAYTGTTLAGLQVVMANDDASGGNTQSQIVFDAAAGTTYPIQISGKTGVTPATGNIVLHISPVLAPLIYSEPQDQFVTVGINLTFTVGAVGALPLSYQWRRNGVNISGATSSSYSIANVQTSQAGLYSVVVSNSSGTATSRDASLTIDDGTIVTLNVNFIAFTNSWKYNQDGPNVGATWMETNFNDSAWPSGSALFGIETTPAVYPEPFRTTLTSLDQFGNFLITYYFRIHFRLDYDPAAVTALLATNFVDDGAVLYLNGAEAGRLRLAAGPVGYSTLATNQQFEGQAEVLNFPLTNLVAGDNVLAVEVHQTSVGSSDVVFGLRLDATLRITNTPPRIVTQPASQTVTVGGSATFNVAATGTALLRYQWRFNGANVFDATNASLTLVNVQTNQAGNYSVVVSNAFGSVTSSNAVLTVQAQVPLQFEPGAFGVSSNGAFQMQLSAPAGASVVIQVSMNLLDWSPVATTSAPNGVVNFTDTNSSSFPLRFYRATLQP